LCGGPCCQGEADEKVADAKQKGFFSKIFGSSDSKKAESKKTEIKVDVAVLQVTASPSPVGSKVCTYTCVALQDLRKILHDDAASELFEAFLAKEYSDENILFWKARTSPSHARCSSSLSSAFKRSNRTTAGASATGSAARQTSAASSHPAAVPPVPSVGVAEQRIDRLALRRLALRR
jgi:hypothetical protein